MNKKLKKNTKLTLSTATIRYLATGELALVDGASNVPESKTDVQNPCRPI